MGFYSSACVVSGVVKNTISDTSRRAANLPPEPFTRELFIYGPTHVSQLPSPSATSRVWIYTEHLNCILPLELGRIV